LFYLEITAYMLSADSFGTRSIILAICPILSIY
jgi:hypothetical protein